MLQLHIVCYLEYAPTQQGRLDRAGIIYYSKTGYLFSL
uniref:Uncharacterized protein n=1 Tax=Anguilla anguilla TaxID=7936 RepID=A0A0E9XT25_ANGAN